MYWVGWLRVWHSSEERATDQILILNTPQLQFVSEQNEKSSDSYREMSLISCSFLTVSIAMVCGTEGR